MTVDGVDTATPDRFVAARGGDLWAAAWLLTGDVTQVSIGGADLVRPGRLTTLWLFPPS